jgi:DNA-binding transcriptional MerR regulator
MIPAKPVTSGEAARRLGISRARLVQLDNVLNPRRSETGQRIYDVSAIERLDAERTTAKEMRRRGR